MGIWQAFIDDSGNKSHSPVLVLGGFVAPYKVWEKFTLEWQRMLDMPCRIEYFKMSEAAAFSDQFYGWSEARRDERVAIAYGVIEDFVSLQLSCIVHLEPYERLIKKMPEAAGNPYYLAFAALISGIAHHQERLGVSEKIDFIFDDQVMEKKQIRDAWDDFKGFVDPSVRKLIGSDPRFEDDKDFLPIQAGDLLAWWVRAMATESINTNPFKMPIPWVPKRCIPGIQITFDEGRILEEMAKFARRAESSAGL